MSTRTATSRAGRLGAIAFACLVAFDAVMVVVAILTAFRGFF